MYETVIINFCLIITILIIQTIIDIILAKNLRYIIDHHKLPKNHFLDGCYPKEKKKLVLWARSISQSSIKRMVLGLSIWYRLYIILIVGINVSIFFIIL